MLRVDKLSKRYDDVWALRDVEFEVGSGEILGIFGGTGAGKSTLLRTLAGVEPHNGGTVAVGGVDVTGAAAKDRNIYLAEEPKRGPLSSIFGSKETPLSNGVAKIREVGETLGSEKKVLLLDEPFCFADLIERDRLIDDIRSAASRGHAVVLASAEFTHIASVCDHVAVMVGGEIRQIDTPQDLYDHPISSAVAAIVGRNNLFAARRLTSTDADLPEFQTIDGGHRIFTRSVKKNQLGAINQNVTLSIRPEQVSISFGASFPEDNVLKAVVTGIRFSGETTLIELDAGGLKLEARVFRVVGLDTGQECLIGMPPERVQVLKD